MHIFRLSSYCSGFNMGDENSIRKKVWNALPRFQTKVQEKQRFEGMDDTILWNIVIGHLLCKTNDTLKAIPRVAGGVKRSHAHRHTQSGTGCVSAPVFGLWVKRYDIIMQRPVSSKGVLHPGDTHHTTEKYFTQQRRWEIFLYLIWYNQCAKFWGKVIENTQCGPPPPNYRFILVYTILCVGSIFLHKDTIFENSLGYSYMARKDLGRVFSKARCNRPALTCTCKGNKEVKSHLGILCATHLHRWLPVLLEVWNPAQRKDNRINHAFYGQLTEYAKPCP